nr:uncharacterized protein CTRU02_05477 [Colletotrichum truncatum]KAF6793920.1 hypothetical protein CTRU02_05477 [Colletotrichum truncatum]
MGYLVNDIPWMLLADWLNKLAEGTKSFNEIESDDFPRNHTLLPEDLDQRGLLWVSEYYPKDWFGTQSACDEPEKAKVRSNKCLWLGYRLAASKMGLVYDKSKKMFAEAAKDMYMTDWVIVGKINGASDDNTDITDGIA